MDITKKLKSKGFFWSAAAAHVCKSFVLGCLRYNSAVWNREIKARQRQSWWKYSIWRLYLGDFLIFVCVCLSLSFVIAVDENSDVCWGKSIQAASHPWSERGFYSLHSLGRSWDTFLNPKSLSNYLNCSQYHAALSWLTWKTVLLSPREVAWKGNATL